MLEAPAGGREIKSSEITKSTRHIGKLLVHERFDKLGQTRPAVGQDQLHLIEPAVPACGSAWALL